MEKNEEVEQLEDALRENDEALNAYLHFYGATSWAEYSSKQQIFCVEVPLPSQTIDAADFLERSSKLECELRACQDRVQEACTALSNTQKAQRHRDSTTLLAKKMDERYKGLQNDVVIAKAEEACVRGAMFRLTHDLKVIDGRAFRAAMEPLLHRRVELMLAHKKRIAEHIITQRDAK